MIRLVLPLTHLPGVVPGQAGRKWVLYCSIWV